MEEFVRTDLINLKDFKSRKKSRQKCYSESDCCFDVTNDGQTTIGVKFEKNKTHRGNKQIYKHKLIKIIKLNNYITESDSKPLG